MDPLSMADTGPPAETLKFPGFSPAKRASKESFTIDFDKGLITPRESNYNDQHQGDESQERLEHFSSEEAVSSPPADPELERLERSVTWKDLAMYFVRQVVSQLQAVVPVSLYFTLYLGFVFKQFLTNVLGIMGGLLLVIIGLVFFLEGLKIFFMPLSERIGWKLPQALSIPSTLGIVTILGILCTYAEPAISALVPLGDLVNPFESPYLYWIMNPWRNWLVFSIGLGVGLSVLLGALRLTMNWKLNPMIYITLVFAIGPAIYLQWVNPHLHKLVPLAWDIGVVATGPVTVPITLALGNGIARSNPKMAKNPLSGFGLVALASLYPIITVQALMLLLSFMYSYDSLLLEIEILVNKQSSEIESIWETSPFQELINSLRAIIPLASMLLIILIFGIREELPEISWYQILKADKEAREEPEETESQANIETSQDNHQVNDGDNHLQRHDQGQHLHEIPLVRLKTGESELHSISSDDIQANGNSSIQRNSSIMEYDSSIASSSSTIIHPRHKNTQRLSNEEVIHSVSKDSNVNSDYSNPSSSETSSQHLIRDSVSPMSESIELDIGGSPNDTSQSSSPPSHDDRVMIDWEDAETNYLPRNKFLARLVSWKRRSLAFLKHHSVFIIGFASVQLGCLLFNWGIVYGLSPLSLQVGGWLPTAYMHVNGILNSPYFNLAVSVMLILGFGFFLGALVTLAEPGMAVFCRQVQALTNGELQTTFLLSTVSVGVGMGLAIGLITLMFHVPTIWIVLGGYPVAVLITVFTPSSGLSAVAWDAAGTVTGPVTTPLVLNLGLAFGIADPRVDGFGVLTCASIFPIVSILLVKRVSDFFLKLKTEARTAAHYNPHAMGVLGATLRWQDPPGKLNTFNIFQHAPEIDKRHEHYHHHESIEHHEHNEHRHYRHHHHVEEAHH